MAIPILASASEGLSLTPSPRRQLSALLQSAVLHRLIYLPQHVPMGLCKTNSLTINGSLVIA